MLPFLTPPAATTTRRIGNERCGILELEVRGGLTVGESATITELLSGEESSYVRGAQIADAIAKEEQLSLTEAFKVIEDAISGRSLEPAAEAIRVRHASRIEDLRKAYMRSGSRNMEATVTALIRSRCSGCTGWSLEDTARLDQALFEGIWQLALDEQAAEDMPSPPPTEDDLKKPQPAAATARPRTGRRSSGN